MLKWLSNTYDPKLGRASDEPKADYAKRMEWLTDKIIGPPKAAEKRIVAELRAWHMVGVYAEMPDPDAAP